MRELSSESGDIGAHISSDITFLKRDCHERVRGWPLDKDPQLREVRLGLLIKSPDPEADSLASTAEANSDGGQGSPSQGDTELPTHIHRNGRDLAADNRSDPTQPYVADNGTHLNAGHTPPTGPTLKRTTGRGSAADMRLDPTTPSLVPRSTHAATRGTPPHTGHTPHATAPHAGDGNQHGTEWPPIGTLNHVHELVGDQEPVRLLDTHKGIGEYGNHTVQTTRTEQRTLIALAAPRTPPRVIRHSVPLTSQ